MTIIRRLPPLLLFPIIAASWAAAAPPELKDVESALKRPIVTSATALAEVQAYCQSRVPRLGKFDTEAAWRAEADRLRAAVLDKVVFRGQAAQWRDAKTKVEWLETIPGGPGYRIRKLRYEALPGMWIPALLYEPENLVGKVPAIMNVNGHSGAIGKADPMKQIRCINHAKRGILALNVEWIGMGQLSTPGFAHTHMNQLDLCGTGGIAPFYLSMKRGLDVLLALEHADPQRIGVTGLSGGGWQTIFISALDPRVTFCTPVAGYSSFITRATHEKDLGDPEQTPCDLATLVDYTHLTAMLAPRPALLIFNSKDNCCFESGYALPPLLEAAEPIYRLFGRPQSLRSHVNDDPGTHNYDSDNRQAHYRALGDFFFPNDKSFDATDLPCKDEIKTRDQLLVELPAKNQDFNTLALTLSQNLPKNGDLPKNHDAALAWQKQTRTALLNIVKAKEYTLKATKTADDSKPGLSVTRWQLETGDGLTMPAVELAGESAKETAILISDNGRGKAGADAARLLAAGYRVIAVDTLNDGDLATKHGWLYCLLIAAVGDRPLGIEAGQVAAAARWAGGENPVTIVASGRRACAIALVAAAMESRAIGRVELHDSLASLKELIERNEAYNGSTNSELFCFGLLETADIKQMAALVAPRPVTFINPSVRTKAELADLARWYRLLGREFDPL